MTARRRRQSGSGPSATALIAWVGGAQSEIGASVSVIYSGPSGSAPSGRAILLGRACGLAAGTLLACGSVLAGATHGSLAGDSAALPNHTPVASGPGSGALDENRGQLPVERTSAAPDPVRTQAAAATSSALHPRLGQIRRNAPVSLDVPAAQPSQHPHAAPPPWDSAPPAAGHAPTGPIAPVRPVLDPAAQGVGRVAPVGGVLAPTNPPAERVGSSQDQQTSRLPDKSATSLPDQSAARPKNEPAVSLPDEPAARPRDERTNGSPIEAVAQVVAPVGTAVKSTLRPVTRPAMTMLTSLLPIG